MGFYNNTIPVITDSMSQSQFQLRSNFQAINQAFATNHSSLTQDDTVSGQHTVLTLRPQGGDPTTTANEIAIYSKLVLTIPQWFYAPNNAQTPIQMTYKSVQTGLQSTNPDVYFANQYSFVAGPFIVYGGLVTNPSQAQLVTLSPSSTLLFVDLLIVDVNAVVLALSVNAYDLLANTFTINYSQFPINGTVNVYYTAIGLP